MIVNDLITNLSRMVADNPDVGAFTVFVQAKRADGLVLAEHDLQYVQFTDRCEMRIVIPMEFDQ